MGADSVSTIIRNTIRQLNTPDHLRGRMTSINQIFFWRATTGEIKGVVAVFCVPSALSAVNYTILGMAGRFICACNWDYSGEEPNVQSAPAIKTQIRKAYDWHI
jgi:hypothetical protein